MIQNYSDIFSLDSEIGQYNSNSEMFRHNSARIQKGSEIFRHNSVRIQKFSA